MVLDGPRPRSADLVAAYGALRPLGVEAYFELVLDESWRDSRAGRDRRGGGGRRAREAALRRRVDPVGRAGGARDRLLPRGGRPVQGHRRAAPRRPPRRGARLPQPAGGHDRAARAGSRRCSPRRMPSALEVADAGRALFTSFGSCSWREPVDGARGAGAPHMTLAYGVLRGGGVCARVDGTVVDLSGLDPLFDSPSLNAFMAAGPEVWRQARVAGRRGPRGGGGRARHAVRGRGLRGLLLVARPRDEPRAACSGPDAEPLLPNWRHLPVGYHGRVGDRCAERDARAAAARPASRARSSGRARGSTSSSRPAS